MSAMMQKGVPYVCHPHPNTIASHVVRIYSQPFSPMYVIYSHYVIACIVIYVIVVMVLNDNSEVIYIYGLKYKHCQFLSPSQASHISASEFVVLACTMTFPDLPFIASCNLTLRFQIKCEFFLCYLP